MQGVDPYLVANSSRRGSMPSSLGYGGAYGGGGAGGSRYGRTRLPILPDMSEHPSVSPVGQGNEGMGGSPQVRAGLMEQQRVQQEASIENSRAIAAKNATGMANQDKSVEAYRVARDKDQSMVDARNQTTQARQLGIDPASSPTDIARAASGATNLKDGTGAGTDAALPTNSQQVATAAAAVQDARNGKQDKDISNAYAQGRTGDVPPVPDAFSRPITPFSAPAEVLSASGVAAPATPETPSIPATPPPSPASPVQSPQVTPPVPNPNAMNGVADSGNTSRYGPKLSGGGVQPVSASTTDADGNVSITQPSAYNRPVKPPLSVQPLNVATR